jgi:hypothetical protein
VNDEQQEINRGAVEGSHDEYFALLLVCRSCADQKVSEPKVDCGKAQSR